jgi:hypothetical protein
VNFRGCQLFNKVKKSYNGMTILSEKDLSNDTKKHTRKSRETISLKPWQIMLAIFFFKHSPCKNMLLSSNMRNLHFAICFYLFNICDYLGGYTRSLSSSFSLSLSNVCTLRGEPFRGCEIKLHLKLFPVCNKKN